MKKIIVTFAIAFSIAGCASKVEEKKIVCANGVCALTDRGGSAAAHSQKNKHNTAVVELTAENFDIVVNQETKPVIVDFYATWCGPCKTIKPIFAELAQEKTDWAFAAVDVDQASEIAIRCGVAAMPTFIVFKNGVQWGSLQGAKEKELFLKELQSIVDSVIPVMPPVESVELQEFISCIAQNNVEEVKRLILGGVDVNGFVKTPMGDAIPLSAAISSEREIIDILLEAGAKISDEFELLAKKQYAMYAAIVEGQSKSFAYAQEAMQNRGPVKREVKLSGVEAGQQLFAVMGDISSLKKLIDEGVDVNAVLSFGFMEMTPLYVAIVSSNRELIDLFISAGASFETEILDQAGCKKTVALTISDSLDMVSEILVKISANIDYILSRK